MFVAGSLRDFMAAAGVARAFPACTSASRAVGKEPSSIAQVGIGGNIHGSFQNQGLNMDPK